MDKRNYIDNHYREVAKNFGLSGRCTLQDPKIRDYEIEFLTHEIQNFIEKFERQPIVLDLGCGNGYSLSVLSKIFKQALFIGVEPQKELFELAKGRELKNVQFFNANALDKNWTPFPVDIIYTERVIINLISEKEQLQAFENISNNLVAGGQYLMIESFLEPLQKINKLRRENLLGEELKQSQHNNYMKFSLLRKLTKFQLFSEPIKDLDRLSSYFFLTRVFHPLTRKEGSKMKENLLLEELESSQNFESLNGRFISPIQFFKFSKTYL